MKSCLIVNHKKEKCGVYQFGKLTYETLRCSKNYDFHYAEVESFSELLTHLEAVRPDIIIYNYHTLTQSWLSEVRIKELSAEIVQVSIGGHGCFARFPSLRKHIIIDPTFEETDKEKKVGRLILDHAPPRPPIPNSVGSFGFGFMDKGWDRVAKAINSEFDTGVLNLHIPFSDFADRNGEGSKRIAQLIRGVLKPEIELNVSHTFMGTQELLNWLSRNSINIFAYDERKGLGISSTIDFALSARRPIAISKSDMFRHIYHKKEILLDQNPIKKIIERGLEPLEEFYLKWSPENLISSYERILDSL